MRSILFDANRNGVVYLYDRKSTKKKVPRSFVNSGYTRD